MAKSPKAKSPDEIIQDWIDEQKSYKACDEAQEEAEKKLRPQLLVAFGNLQTARYEVGRLISDYKGIFKGTYLTLYEALGLEERTARNYENDYVRASAVPESLRLAAARGGYDLSEKWRESLCVDLAGRGETKPERVDAVVEAAIKRYEAKRTAERKRNAEERRKADEEAAKLTEEKENEETSEADPESHEVPLEEDLVSVKPMKDRLDRNIENALESMTRDELADAIADFVKARNSKKPLQRAA